MTNRQTFIFLLILAQAFAFGQKDKFNLLDSGLRVGSRFTTWQILYADKNDETYAPESSKLIDSIIWFLKKHNNIGVEIQDYRETNSSLNHSIKSAKNLLDTLVKKGISSLRLSEKGFAGTKPLFADSLIEKAKTKKVEELMRTRNRRTVLEIKWVNYVSTEVVSKSKCVGEIIYIPNDALIQQVELWVTVKGKLRQVFIQGTCWTEEAKNLLVSADNGSTIYFDLRDVRGNSYTTGHKVIR